MLILKIIKVILVSFMKWACICLPLTILGILILPLVLVFVPKNVEVLPKVFRWFDNYSTHDNLFGHTRDGLSGDQPYRERRIKEGHTNLFWERYYWLALRNPINYFSVEYLGKDKVHVREVHGNPYTSDQGESGWVYKWGYDIDNSKLEEFYFVYAYKLFSKNLCVRARFGYKLAQWKGSISTTSGFVFTINPVMPYRPGGFNK